MEKKILLVLIGVVFVVTIVGGIFVYSLERQLNKQPLTEEDALKILKADTECANPDNVEKFSIIKDLYYKNYKIPVGTYWKSEVYRSSGYDVGPSNGCWFNCYLDINDREKIYYDSGCV